VHAPTLGAHFRDQPSATIKEAQDEIEQLTSVRRCETQVRHFLLCLGMRCRKVGMVSSKADPAAQATYLAETIQPRLAEAQAEENARCSSRMRPILRIGVVSATMGGRAGQAGENRNRP